MKIVDFYIYLWGIINNFSTHFIILLPIPPEYENIRIALRILVSIFIISSMTYLLSIMLRVHLLIKRGYGNNK